MTSTRATARNVVVILLTTLAVLFAVYLLYRLSAIIEMITVAVFLAVAVNPLVNRVRRRHVKRVPAILIVFLALFLALLVIFGLAFPSLVEQVKGIITVLQQPGGLTEQVQKVARPLGLSGLVASLRPQIDSLPQQLGSAIGSLTTVTSNTVNAGAAILTVIVLMFFMLNDGERLLGAGVALFPEKQQPRVRRVLEQSARAVSGYVSGNLTISAIAGAGVFIGMTILGVRYALALAVLLAVIDLIPLVGATLGAIPPILGALAISPVKALILLAYIIVYQQIESHVLNPLVYGRSVHLPGMVVVLSVIVGGTLMGIAGALIAIPVAEIIRLLLNELRSDQRLEASSEASRPAARNSELQTVPIAETVRN